MKSENRRNTIRQTLTGFLFSLLLGFIVLGTSSVSANAQTRTAAGATRPSIFYYAKNYQAVNKQRLEMRRGNAARVYFDTSRQRWAVEVRYAATVTTTTRRNENWSADGGKLPNGASIIYSPTRELAESIYKASLRQGDWAKMWYDAKRRDWAVAVKPR